MKVKIKQAKVTDTPGSHRCRLKTPASSKPIVLVVDDMWMMRVWVKGVLETQMGLQVIEADKSAAALQLAQGKQAIALVISDIYRNDDPTDGLTFLQVFKNEHPNIPVLIISGMAADDMVRQQALRLGAFDCFSKPLTPDTLIGVVSKVLQA